MTYSVGVKMFVTSEIIINMLITKIIQTMPPHNLDLARLGQLGISTEAVV